MTVMMITSNVTNPASSILWWWTQVRRTASIDGATVSATMQPLSESTIMPSVTTSTLTETDLYSFDLSTPTISPHVTECPDEFYCNGVQNIPLFISLFFIAIVGAVTALVCCIYCRCRLKQKYHRRYTLVQRPRGNGPAAPPIEEVTMDTTIAGVEGQPRRECNDNYAEVDKPAKKKIQLGGGDNNIIRK